MTTINTYLSKPGNDTKGSNLRNALIAQSYSLNDGLRVAATHVDSGLSDRLRDPNNAYHIPHGLVSRFIVQQMMHGQNIYEHKHKHKVCNFYFIYV